MNDYKIISNKIKCNKCQDIIESTHTHDFKWCSCGSVAVDGGNSYLKRCYHNEGDIIELSIIEINGETMTWEDYTNRKSD